MNDKTETPKRGRGRPTGSKTRIQRDWILMPKSPGRPKGSKDVTPRALHGPAIKPVSASRVIEPWMYRTCSAEGMSAKETAEFLGVSDEAVHWARIHLNLPFTLKSNQVDHRRLLKLAAEGKSAQEIADEIGCRSTTVRSIAKIAGVKVS